VWGDLGCAVPQPGRYIQTSNKPIWDFVTVTGRQLFSTLWQYPDRLFDRFPSRDCLYEIYQLLVIGRKRLADRTVLPNQTPLQPTRGKPAYQMFKVFPTPLYGPMGCPNVWLSDVVTYGMMMLSEAMQHSDNELSFYWTKEFHDTIYPYIKYMLTDMGTKFFGISLDAASKDDFVIPDSAWQTYNPAQFSVSVEGTSSRPPMGYIPTDLDLEGIRGLPIENVIPFLQEWPDSQLKYASGGIWNSSSQPAGQAVGASGTPATGAPSLYTSPNSPPSGS
jgi:hypothetical protein